MLTIADQLGILKQLQTVDSAIYRLRRELAVKPHTIETLRAELAAQRQQLAALEERSTTLQMQRKNRELELATQEDKVKKLQAQLFQVKTNKEYTAMQHEIEGAKADGSLLEEMIIRLLEDMDQVQQQVIRAKAEWQQREVQTQQDVRRIEGEIAQVQQDLQRTEADRQRLAPSLEPGVLATYDRILRSHDGLALVPLMGEACGGCHMVLPPQIINEVAQQTRIVNCETCARLLYAPDEP